MYSFFRPGQVIEAKRQKVGPGKERPKVAFHYMDGYSISDVYCQCLTRNLVMEGLGSILEGECLGGDNL